MLLGPGGLLAGLPAGADLDRHVHQRARRWRTRCGRLPGPAASPCWTRRSAGGVTGATDGTLQIFVGGDRRTLLRVRPLLEVMGDPERILHVGPHGAGYTVKLMLNLLWFATVVVTAEVLTIGVRAGVDLATLRRSLLASAAASHFLEHDVLSVLERGDFDDSFALALGLQGPGLAVDLARRPACRPR